MADKKSGVVDRKTERDERLAKALRENLRRRKAHKGDRLEPPPQDDRPTD